MTPVTRELALRLERAEVAHLSRQVETYSRLYPQVNGRLVPAAGGVAAVTDPRFGRKLNHVVGLGMGAAVGAADLAGVEAAYDALGLPTEIDLCPFADPSALPALAARGYAVNAFSNVYLRELTDADLTVPADGVRVEPVAAGDGPRFVAACVAGFAVQTAPRPVELRDALARVALARADTTLFLAFVGGTVVRSAGLALLDAPVGRVAHVYIASTLPAFRGRGVQTALIRARLAVAWAAGCTLASATARPANASARNAERVGFRVAYTRPTFVRPAG